MINVYCRQVCITIHKIWIVILNMIKYKNSNFLKVLWERLNDHIFALNEQLNILCFNVNFGMYYYEEAIDTTLIWFVCYQNIDSEDYHKMMLYINILVIPLIRNLVKIIFN